MSDPASKPAENPENLERETPPASDKGYPDATPVAEMQPSEQAAYYRHQAAKHEARNKALLGITGGKFGDALKADLDELATLRESTLSDTEKLEADAEKRGAAAASAKYSSMLVAAEFRAALATVDPERREALMTNLAPAFNSFVTEQGEVDTDKVQAIAKTLTPTPVKDDPPRHDFGQGTRRTNVDSQSGMQAGADMFAASRGK